MLIVINNKEVEVSEGINVANLIGQFKYSKRSIVKINKKIIRLQEYEKQILKNGDVLEIIPFMIGG